MSQLDNLVQRCQLGELAAFSELFHHVEARVYRLAMTILQNEQDAEDAVQDVYLRIFERIKSYSGEAAFMTWLTTIVVNICRDKLRRHKVRRALSLDWLRNRASGYDLVEDVAQRQQQRQLWTLVNQLDEKHRFPVILHYHERIPCDEVATILKIRTSTVYSRLNTARHRLRVMLRDQGGNEKMTRELIRS
ncbi:MAG: RNA polymerase sigma factor [Chloroflexi bacterium]|nr:RNA polymerase sigma factor [Chloroflexota bacterium]